MDKVITGMRKLTVRPRKSRRPWLLEVRSSKWFITATVCTAIFTDVFLYDVIVPVFPFSLVSRVGVAPDDVQHWMSVFFSIYGASLLVAAPIFGWLSDHINSRRSVLLGGMIMLGGSTVMFCLARSLPILIIGRVLQGGAAGVVWVVALALLADTVGKDRAGQAMGYVALAYSIAALVAPLLGGVVYSKSGYYAVFAMGFGMIALDIFLRLVLIEKKHADRWLSSSERQPDPSATVEGLDQSTEAYDIPTTGAKHPNVMQSSGVPSNPLTVTAKPRPAILILIKSRRMQATFCASTIISMILTGFNVTLPLFVQDTFHWNSLGAGLLFLALLLSSFLQPLYGWGVDKYGARWISAAGLLMCAPPFVCLRFVTHNSMGQKVLLCALIFIIGFGSSLTLAGVMAEFMLICVEKERKQPGCMGKSGAYAQSYGLFNVSWALGSLIGSYFSGGIKQAAGFGTMGWAFALLCAVFAIPTVCCVGGSIFAKKTRTFETETETETETATTCEA